LCPGPKYAVQPRVVQVDSMTATITWSTDTLSDSRVVYGTSTSYTDSVSDAAEATEHTIVLTGLTPRTLYHFRVISSDIAGGCYSSDRILVTWPPAGTPGDIALYFNYDVDNSVKRGGVPNAQGNVDVKAKLIDLINSAHRTLDCALYSFSLNDVT